jgi:hypothetical protein
MGDMKRPIVDPGLVARLLQPKSCHSKMMKRWNVAANVNEALARRLVAARVPREALGEVYLKLAYRDLPDDDKQAKRYVDRTARHVFIDEVRDGTRNHVFACDPFGTFWETFARDPLISAWWDSEHTLVRDKLHVLVEIGIALLSPHERSLVRQWAMRSDHHKPSVIEIHENLEEPCGRGAHLCRRTTFDKLMRIVRGLATETGVTTPEPRTGRSKKRPVHRC